MNENFTFYITVQEAKVESTIGSIFKSEFFQQTSKSVRKSEIENTDPEA